ncbi:Spo0B domain-containing protein [Paenibacillus alkalitolerans]|uniref:Spo0B domain-containing protein n=1 Tax=Paenibacillus alkalitolerans TaxID=2799335 RepID=UPI001F27766A|nr:Spo0B domain-containing protein [Paenibacillus alkalitolerans]
MKRAEEFVSFPNMLDEHRKLWINTMNHARHDWLNDLQLIMGYAQMKKYDKLAACVDMLKQRLTEESRAAKLGDPGLIELLYTYRARPLPYRFELELDEPIDVTECLSPGNDVAASIRIALGAFELAVMNGNSGNENVLRCCFRKRREDMLVELVFTGAYASPELRSAAEEIAEIWKNKGNPNRIETDLSEGAALLSLLFPLRA